LEATIFASSSDILKQQINCTVILSGFIELLVSEDFLGREREDHQEMVDYIKTKILQEKA